MEACLAPTDIVVINLDRATAALEAFLLRNDHLGPVRRFPGIDGTDIDRAALVSRGDIVADIAYTDGMLGCTLSHFALWREVADGTRPLTVCEDDAILAHGFIATANARLADLPDDWDIVLWGWNFDSWMIYQVLPGLPGCLLFGDPTVTADNLTAASAEASRLFPLDRACGTLCYTLSPKGAVALLALCRPVRPMPIYMPEAAVNLPNSGIDLMMSMFYPRLRAYVSVPPRAISPNLVANSTTRATKPDNVMSPAGLLRRIGRLPLEALVGALARDELGANPLTKAGFYRAWIDANPTSPLLFAAWFNLGIAFEEINDRGNATTSYQNALVLKPDFQPARAIGRHDVALTGMGVVRW